MDVAPLLLATSGIVTAAVGFYNRAEPDWQRNMFAVYVLAIGQVVLGLVVWVVLR